MNNCRVRKADVARGRSSEALRVLWKPALRIFCALVYDKSGSRTNGLSFASDEAVLKPKAAIDLSRFGGVADMDSATGLLLVEGKSDMFNTWGIFSIDSSKYKSLGKKKGLGLFLN